MTYFTGTATDQIDLLDKIQVHAATLSWVVSDSGSDRIFEKDGFKVTATPEVAFTTGFETIDFRPESTVTGAFSLGVIGQHANNEVRCGPIDEIASLGAYHCYINTVTPRIFVVFEVLPKIWRHFAFGILTKLGSWTGGAFAIATYNLEASWNSFVSNNNYKYFETSDGFANDERGMFSYTDDVPNLTWAEPQNTNSYLTQRYCNYVGLELPLSSSTTSPASSFIQTHQPNSGTGEIIMQAIEVAFVRDGGLFSLGGYLDDIRVCNISGLLDAQTITIGADDWMFFPEIAQGFIIDTGLVAESAGMGIAYKK